MSGESYPSTWKEYLEVIALILAYITIFVGGILFVTAVVSQGGIR